MSNIYLDKYSSHLLDRILALDYAGGIPTADLDILYARGYQLKSVHECDLFHVELIEIEQWMSGSMDSYLADAALIPADPQDAASVCLTFADACSTPAALHQNALLFGTTIPPSDLQAVFDAEAAEGSAIPHCTGPLAANTQMCLELADASTPAALHNIGLLFGTTNPPSDLQAVFDAEAAEGSAIPHCIGPSATKNQPGMSLRLVVAAICQSQTPDDGYPNNIVSLTAAGSYSRAAVDPEAPAIAETTKKKGAFFSYAMQVSGIDEAVLAEAKTKGRRVTGSLLWLKTKNIIQLLHC